jgi:hypothetical protein
MISFSELSKKELRLLYAVYGMHMQYAGKNDELYTRADETMSFYGLWDLIEGDTKSVVEKSSELHRTVDKLDSEFLKFNFNPIDGDVAALNDRSIYILVLLAALSNKDLKIYKDSGDNESMFHDHMSAGEGAFVELQKYGLMVTDNSGCGHWTELGYTFVALASHLDRFPPVEHFWSSLQKRAQ